MKAPAEPGSLLMTTDAVGGVWTYALEMCRALPRTKIVLATMGPRPSAAQRAEVATLEHVELVESDFALEWMDDPWRDVKAAGEWLLSLEALHAPGLVHLNGYVHAALPWRAPVLVVAHSCVLSWWEAVKGGPAPAEWSRYRHAVSAGIAAADCVVAPTAAMLRAVERHYGSPLATRVIPNGADSCRFATQVEKEPLVFSAGRLWDEAKNAAAVIEAAAGLPWPVVLAGDTGGADTERRENVHFAGQCTSGQMTSWFQRASVYALPARYEPFGLSALEAALAGSALVLGDIPSLREVWGDAALWVKPDDPPALHRALRLLIDDPCLRKEFAEKARCRATCFTTTRMLDAYVSLYRSMTTDSISNAAQPAA